VRLTPRGKTEKQPNNSETNFSEQEDKMGNLKKKRRKKIAKHKRKKQLKSLRHKKK